MNFYRTNYNTYEAQNFSERVSHDYEHVINFSENESNNFDKIKPHMIKLISTGSYIVFLDLKFYRHEHMTKIEFYKNSQNFLSRKLFITIKVYLTSIK